ncbi:flagellar basal body L-ring protein FlgH [Magnetofaba australis]|nr:flagellar basal body L-ring protein FlgH [Magnetofaba australis]
MKKSAAYQMMIAASALALLSGCGTITRASQRPAAPVSMVRAQAPEVMAPNKGSIWQSAQRNALFTDNKARSVGDILTVNIAETINATKSSNTTLSKNDESKTSLGGLFGLTAALQAGGLSKFTDSATIKSENTHEGEGEVTRSGNFTGSIACVVTEVLPNGYFRIEGRRDITLNNDNEFIILSGIVRPDDISPDNSISSQMIADARIEFSGEGDISNQQKPSWTYQLLTAALPLF